MKKKKTKILQTLFTLFFCIVLFPALTFGQTQINYDANRLLQRVLISVSPRSGTFVEGSTFEVPIILDTRGVNINGIEVRVNYDKNKLSIIKPSGGTSIIGVWVEPPSFDNNRGVASYVGVVPNGITTSSGIIGTITFKVIGTGRATVGISTNSKILLNDGIGTPLQLDMGRADYDLIPKPPEGLTVYSETHPYSGEWYNNDSPVLSWEILNDFEGFSYVLDNKPSTIPPNEIISKDNLVSFENLKDGLWYFHIKAKRKGVWGNTTHFLIKIDTTPPADFRPEINHLLASASLSRKVLVSFFTTDNLSGVNRYEVGVINKNDSNITSPVFIQTESPYQVPLAKGGKVEIIVRAIDNAGNVRDVSVDARSTSLISDLAKNYIIYLVIAVIFILLSLILTYIIYRKRKKNEITNNNNVFLKKE